MKQPKIILFDDIGKHGITGYLGYSYANIYYEMIFQLARKNEMNMNKVTKLLKKLNFHVNDTIRMYKKGKIKMYKIVHEIS